MSIRRMTVGDLQMVLGWAGEEGWNPGVDDASAFFAADPDGFFINEVAGKPAAAISVVNHDAHFAFLGLYICRPEFRGRGLGMEIWQAGLAHSGGRCVGLDGVPAQQDNYAKSGFTKYGRTVRFEGALPKNTSDNVRPAKLSDLKDLVEADAAATGIKRAAYSRHWFSNTHTRQTFIQPNGRGIAAFATSRQCVDGIKVGPLHADTAEQALSLLGASSRNSADDALYVDVPDHSTQLIGLLEKHGFKPIFETARMYSSDPPSGRAPLYYAIGTMELG